jgi:predicted nucleotidyltransferase
MRGADIIGRLCSHVPEIRALGATSLYLFGSADRGEARPDSAIALFVDYDPERFSFVELICLRERLSDLLSRRADLTTREGLHPLLRAVIEAEAVKVF